MKKTHLLILLATCSSIISSAQVRTYEASDQSIAISINPVFGYVGNLFNDNGSNNLNLSSAGIIYRKFRTPQRAFRLSGNVSYFQNSIFSDFVYSGNNITSNTETTTSVNANLGIGTEYRKHITKWSLYAGWQILAAYQNLHSRVDSPDRSYFQFQITERNNGARVSAGPGIFGGAEYLLGDLFFVGMEVNAALLAGYQFAPSVTVADYSGGNLLLRKNEGKNSFTANVSSSNIVVFRAGLRF